MLKDCEYKVGLRYIDSFKLIFMKTFRDLPLLYSHFHLTCAMPQTLLARMRGKRNPLTLLVGM
jgi:hypothetical protein